MMGRCTGISHCQVRRGERESLISSFWATFEYSLMSVNSRIFDIKIVIVIIDIVIKARAACCKVLWPSCFSTTPPLKPFSLSFIICNTNVIDNY